MEDFETVALDIGLLEQLLDDGIHYGTLTKKARQDLETRIEELKLYKKQGSVFIPQF